MAARGPPQGDGVEEAAVARETLASGVVPASAGQAGPRRRQTIAYMARMRGGVNFLCDTLRALGWLQGGFRDCSSCDIYMAGPQVGLKLDTDEDFLALRADQACSRFPKMEWVTLKAPTTRLLGLLSRFHGGALSMKAEGSTGITQTTSPILFYPPTFVLPEQMGELEAGLDNCERGHCYILKPSKGSQGKGIELRFGKTAIKQAAQRMSSDGPCIAQHYIHTPHTICNMKWDARIYCVVTSVGLLRVWVYMDGLA